MRKILYLDMSRGTSDHGWLKSRHTFSFANYHDPDRMGFGMLRVFNDDLVSQGQGFSPHFHQDMEIISITLSGSLHHQDNTGQKQVIRPGDVQIMSAGTGIQHSEYNNSPNDPVHFLQIWVVPDKRGLSPRYEQNHFLPAERMGRFQMVISPDGRENSLRIHQNAFVFLTSLPSGWKGVYEMTNTKNGLFMFVMSGSVHTAGEVLAPRDSIGLTDLSSIDIDTGDGAEVLLMEIPVL